MSEGLGQIAGTLGPTTRIGTLSPYDFAYWASTFVAEGTPSDYTDVGPETDGASLVSWAASQIAVSFPAELDEALVELATEATTVAEALPIRGALLYTTTKIAVCLGFNDIIDIVNGRYFITRLNTVGQARWTSGAYLPGAIY